MKRTNKKPSDKTSEIKANNFTCGISFRRKQYPHVERFLDFVRSNGYGVSVNRGSVHVVGLQGNLKAMAHVLFALGREFDDRNGTLIVNTLVDVWEFRECCKTHRELSWPIDEVETILEDPIFEATGRWRAAGTLRGHRHLGQVFVTADEWGGPSFGRA